MYCANWSRMIRCGCNIDRQMGCDYVAGRDARIRQQHAKHSRGRRPRRPGAAASLSGPAAGRRGTAPSPERALSEILGVSRGDLRKALAIMERDGRIWRHVGKGTFVGIRPLSTTIEIADIAARTTPSDVMRARLLLEPQIAREAALHATIDDIAAMRSAQKYMRDATSWRQYETLDNLLHRLIAQASGNILLVGLFDVLNATRRTVVWGRLRSDGARPRPTITASPIMRASSTRSRSATCVEPPQPCSSTSKKWSAGCCRNRCLRMLEPRNLPRRPT